jgi:methionyl-tRNA formyltransferase
VQHALLNGDTITGVTIFRLDEGMDTGDILSSVQTQIQPRENTEDLLDRLTQLGITLLDESLAKIEANIATFTAQVGTSSLAGKISRQDAVIDWRKNCLVIERLIRAMNPEPIAWTNFGSDSLRIFDAQSTSMRSDLKPGEVFSINGKAYVSCGENSVLEILEVQPAGKNRMRATDWLRGLNQNVVLGG